MNDLSPEARALLDIARDADDPSPGDRLRIQRALAASVATGAAIGSASTAAAAATSSGAAGASAVAGVAATKIATWLGVGMVAGVVSAGAMVLVSRGPDAARAPTESQRAVPAAKELPRAPEIRVPAAVQGPAAAPAAAPEGTGLRDDVAKKRSPPRAASSSLPAETALLEAARSALGRGDAHAALAALGDHERQFPSGALTEERLASKVFALCGLGRRDEARRAATELLRLAPSSPLRARVLDSCAYGQ